LYEKKTPKGKKTYLRPKRRWMRRLGIIWSLPPALELPAYSKLEKKKKGLS
jgi:hypothetical protein